MRLTQALKEKLMDVRIRDRFIAEKKLDKQDLEEYLRSLQDDSVRTTSDEQESRTFSGTLTTDL
jgi:hypothetical protein